MIPASLAVGNTLTLIEVHHGRANDNGVMEWQQNTAHKGLNRPRVVMSNRSTYAELGEELSMLQYPKKSQFTETADTLTLTYIDAGDKSGQNGRAIGTKLVYTVQKGT
jgi:hypothetical protein